MAFKKTTIITGKTKSLEFKCLIMAGHWNIKSAISRARKSKIKGKINIEHSVWDMSGKGRSGHDGRWTIGHDDSVLKKAEWSEFGKEHFKDN